jgi:hypothetical protein
MASTSDLLNQDKKHTLANKEGKDAYGLDDLI